MSISNLRYHISYNAGAGQITKQVTPLDAGAAYSLSVDEYIRRAGLNATLIFYNEPSKSIFDYTKIKDAEQYDPFQEITLSIEQFQGGGWVLLCQSYFAPIDCEIDDNRCSAKVKPDIDDVYKCVYDDWENEYNVLAEVPVAPSYIINNPVNLEYFVCERTYYNVPTGCATGNPVILNYGTSYQQNLFSPVDGMFYDFGPISPGANPNVYDTHQFYDTQTVLASADFYLPGFPYISNTQNIAYIISLYRIFRSEYTIIGCNTLGECDLKCKTTWCIETAVTLNNPQTGAPVTPTGAGWLPLLTVTQSGLPAVKWGREAFYDSPLPPYKYIYMGGDCDYFFFELLNPYSQQPASSIYINRGRLLNDTIQMFLNKSGCGLTLKSEFFQNSINPVVNQLNAFYILNQCTDIKTPTSTEAAIFMFLTLKKLMDNLAAIFDLRWHISGTDFIIEHISYYANGYTYLTSQIPIVDLRNRIAKQTGRQEIIFTNNYRYDVPNIYKSEKWTNSQYIDFDFSPLQVDYNLSIVKDAKIKETNIDFILDVAGVIASPADFANDGIVMTAYRISTINPQYGQLWPVCINEPGYRTGVDVTNGWLCLSNLFNRFWRHNRIRVTGTLNGQTENFITETKKIIQNVEVADCNCNFVDDNVLCQTNLGTGEIIAAENNLATGITSLTLKI